MNYLQDFYGSIDDCTQFEIKVILNELILNAVKHGIKEDDNKHDEVTASITKDNCDYMTFNKKGNKITVLKKLCKEA